MSGQRFSQITSTPEKCDHPPVLSPMLSSIYASSSHNESESEEGAVSYITSALTDTALNITLENYSKILKDGEKEKRSGALWNLFKSTSKNTLYYKLLKNSSETEAIVIELYQNFFRQDHKFVLVNILKLLVDLCKCQSIKLDQLYEAETNPEHLIKLMQNTLLDPELNESGNYLLKNFSSLANIFKISIYNFCYKLILVAYRLNILYHSIFNSLFNILRHMSFSSYKPIRHTGIIFSVKFLTALVNIYSEDKENLENSPIEDYINYLYNIFGKNCCISDPKLYILRLEFSHEMVNWMILCPFTFFTKNSCLRYLPFLVEDDNKAVRLRTLKSCEMLVTTVECQELIEKHSHQLIKSIKKRLMDVDDEVAIKAVNIFTKLVQRFSSLVTEPDIFSILDLIYQDKIKLAKASGEFLVNYIHKQNQNKLHASASSLLLRLAEINNMPQFNRGKPLLVEACLPSAKELQNWDLIINLLVDDNIAEALRISLLELTSESVHQFLTGKPTVNRAITSRAVISGTYDSHQKIIISIFPFMNDLILKYQQHEKSLNELFKIVLLVDHTLITRNFNPVYREIFKLSDKIFSDCTDNKDLINTICKLFLYFCETIQGFRDEAKVIMERLKKKYVEQFLSSLKNSPSDSLEIALKIGTLFSHFDLTNLVKWEDIFSVQDNILMTTVPYLITCQKWYLIWSLKNLTKTQQIRAVPVLSNSLSDFSNLCFDLIKNSKDLETRLLAYGAFCDIYYNFTVNNKFPELNTEILDGHLEKTFFSFVASNIVENKKLPLNKRKAYLMQTIHLIQTEVFPTECFSYILKYYHKYEELSDVMETILDLLKLVNPSLSLLIMHTLADYYEELLTKYAVIDIKSDSVKDLKLLAKSFSVSKKFQSYNDVLKLLNMAILFAFRSKENFPFLYFVRYFIHSRREDFKADLHGVFHLHRFERLKNSAFTLLFAGNLNRSQTKK